jgi:hypothetical protein
MNFQSDSLAFTTSEPPAASGNESADLLRQILAVQREQLAYLRASVAAHDMGARWRAYLQRWQKDFPDLSDTCRKAVPVLERSYGKLITELTDHLHEQGNDGLDTDFELQEFLDRYGMRLAQLGTILNLVAPLAEAGPAAGESA